MNAAELLVHCLENEGVDYVFGIPGEENIHIMDALAQSRIRFVITRHEQGAAFMADVYGRLTGRAGVCLATLGPGATNLITGVADANMDRAPLVAIAGQAATTRMHKESHQVLHLAALFSHCTKFSAQVLEPEIVPEVVRKAFKLAQTEKPGASFIEVPENVAQMAAQGFAPLKVQAPAIPRAPQAKVDQIARLIDEAEAPLVLVGNGAIRQRASAAVVAFIERLNLPAVTTFMAKGAVPFSHPLCLGTIGLQARDPVAFGLDGAVQVAQQGADDTAYPLKPQRVIADLRRAMADEDVLGLIGSESRYTRTAPGLSSIWMDSSNRPARVQHDGLDLIRGDDGRFEALRNPRRYRGARATPHPGPRHAGELDIPVRPARSA